MRNLLLIFALSTTYSLGFDSFSYECSLSRKIDGTYDFSQLAQQTGVINLKEGNYSFLQPLEYMDENVAISFVADFQTARNTVVDLAKNSKVYQSIDVEIKSEITIKDQLNFTVFGHEGQDLSDLQEIEKFNFVSHANFKLGDYLYYAWCEVFIDKTAE